MRVLEAAAAEARFDVAADETERALAAARPPAAGPAALAGGRGRARRSPCRGGAVLASPSARRRPGTSRPRRSPRSAGRGRCSRSSSGSRPARPEGSPRRPAPAGSTPPAAGRLWTQARPPARWSTRRSSSADASPATTRPRAPPSWRVVRRAGDRLRHGRRPDRRLPPGAPARLGDVGAHGDVPGRSAYRFSLPVMRLADAARVAQVVTVDARTLLPERIVWRVRGPGPARTVAVIDIRTAHGGRARPRAAGRVHARRSPPRHGDHPACRAGAARAAVSTRAAHPGRGRAHCDRARLARAARSRGPRARTRSRLPLHRRRRRAAALRPAASSGTTGRSCRRRCSRDLLVPVKQFPVGARTARLYATAGGMFAVEIDRPGGTAVVIAPPRRPQRRDHRPSRLRPLPTAGAG